jgi:hypothetical protein
MKKWILYIIMLVLLTACLPNDAGFDMYRRAGFFTGVWHGWIAPFSLIIGLFNPNVRVYEVYNTGWWYDFGYYAAIISGFGGLSLSRKKYD